MHYVGTSATIEEVLKNGDERNKLGVQKGLKRWIKTNDGKYFPILPENSEIVSESELKKRSD